MADGVVKELAEIIASHDILDKRAETEHNVSVGLRHDDGSGVPVGITRVGDVIGYKRIPLSKLITGSANQAAEGEMTVDPVAIYQLVNGGFPSDAQLEAFLPKLQELLPHRLEPVEGKLLYCGIGINDIVTANEHRYGYEETAYLLLTGELPTPTQLKKFSEYLRSRRALPLEFRDELIYKLTSNDLMIYLQKAVLGLHGKDQNPNSIRVEDVTRHSIDIIAKFPAIVAYAYHAMMYNFSQRDLKIVMPSEGREHATDFLTMLKAGEPFTETEAHLLDTMLILHAEHGGGNNSTFTVRSVSSTQTDTFSAISAGLASLKGPLHGGANEQVRVMMEDIKKNVGDWKDNDEVYQYLCRMLRKEAGDKSGLIYGVGHAVYTLSDPRALLLREYAKGLAEAKGRAREFALLCLVGDLAPRAYYEVKGKKKVVAPNVDFYSGLVFDCMGIPPALYTPMFALARVAGWSAHRLEQLVHNKLLRPAYVSVTPERQYTPLEKR